MDILEREELRKQEYFVKLGEQIDQLLPGMIKKAEQLSVKGKLVRVEKRLKPRYDTISFRQNHFDEWYGEGLKAQEETEQWIIDRADRRLEELGLPFRAGFIHWSTFLWMISSNRLVISLPD